MSSKRIKTVCVWCEWYVDTQKRCKYVRKRNYKKSAVLSVKISFGVCLLFVIDDRFTVINVFFIGWPYVSVGSVRYLTFSLLLFFLFYWQTRQARHDSDMYNTARCSLHWIRLVDNVKVYNRSCYGRKAHERPVRMATICFLLFFTPRKRLSFVESESE